MQRTGGEGRGGGADSQTFTKTLSFHGQEGSYQVQVHISNGRENLSNFFLGLKQYFTFLSFD